GGWHGDVLYTEFRQSIDERVGYRRQRTDTARFAGALDAKWVGLGRNRIAFDHHVTQVARAWHGVIHERGGVELLNVVGMDIFHLRLAGALRDSGRRLALEQHGIEH